MKLILLFLAFTFSTTLSFSLESRHNIKSISNIYNRKASNYILNSQDNDKVETEEFYSVKSNEQKSGEAKLTRDIEQKQNIEGFINNDLLSMESGKQVRVTLYILLAILPCLLLIPFMMDRSFIPADIDPSQLTK